jgi:hypothetical protein
MCLAFTLTASAALSAGDPDGVRRSAAPGRDPAIRVENPDYARWARLKAGTVLVQKGSGEAGDARTETVSEIKLAKLDETAATVQSRTTLKAAGEEKVTTDRWEVQRWLPPGAAAADRRRPSMTYESGEDKLEVLGKRAEVVWFKTKEEKGGGRFLGQIWFTADLPVAVKSATSVERDGVVQFQTRMELVEVRAP